MPRRDRSYMNRHSSDPVWEPSIDFFLKGGGVPGTELCPINEACANDDMVTHRRAAYQNGSDNGNILTEYSKSEDYYKLNCENENRVLDANKDIPPPRSCYLFLRSRYKVFLTLTVLCGILLQIENKKFLGRSLFSSLGIDRSQIMFKSDEVKQDEVRNYPQNITRITSSKHYRTTGIYKETAGNLRIPSAKSKGNKYPQAPGADLLLAPATPLPKPELHGYKNTWDPHEFKDDVPVFWHVPKAGGSTIN